MKLILALALALAPPIFADEGSTPDLPNENMPGNSPSLPNSNLPGSMPTDNPLTLPNSDTSLAVRPNPGNAAVPFDANGLPTRNPTVPPTEEQYAAEQQENPWVQALQQAQAQAAEAQRVAEEATRQAEISRAEAQAAWAAAAASAAAAQQQQNAAPAENAAPQQQNAAPQQ